MNNKVFIIDDDSAVCNAIKQVLEGVKYKVTSFTSCSTALTAVHREHFDVLIADLKLADGDGVKFIAAVNELKPHVPIMAITGYGSVPLAVAAVNQGASEFLEKPFDRDVLLSLIKKLNDNFFERHKHWHEALTDAEISVLELLMVGKSTKEIARMQHRSPRTIDHHRARVLAAMNNHADLLSV
jgi:FixJ family two-component response regulator